MVKINVKIENIGIIGDSLVFFMRTEYNEEKLYSVKSAQKLTQAFIDGICINFLDECEDFVYELLSLNNNACAILNPKTKMVLYSDYVYCVCKNNLNTSLNFCIDNLEIILESIKKYNTN